MESRKPWRWTARVSRNTETLGKVKYGAAIVKTNWGIRRNDFPITWAWRKATLVLGRVSYRTAVLQGISAVSPRFNHKNTSIFLLLIICRLHRTKYIQLTKQEMQKLPRGFLLVLFLFLFSIFSLTQKLNCVEFSFSFGSRNILIFFWFLLWSIHHWVSNELIPYVCTLTGVIFAVSFNFNCLMVG